MNLKSLKLLNPRWKKVIDTFTLELALKEQQRKEFLLANQDKIKICQSIIRMKQQRDNYRDMMNHYRNNVPKIVLVQRAYRKVLNLPLTFSYWPSEKEKRCARPI